MPATQTARKLDQSKTHVMSFLHGQRNNQGIKVFKSGIQLMFYLLIFAASQTLYLYQNEKEY